MEKVAGMETKIMTYSGFFVCCSDGGMGVLVEGQENVNPVRQFCTSSNCCAKITLPCVAIWYRRSR